MKLSLALGVALLAAPSALGFVKPTGTYVGADVCMLGRWLLGVRTDGTARRRPDPPSPRSIRTRVCGFGAYVNAPHFPPPNANPQAQ